MQKFMIGIVIVTIILYGVLFAILNSATAQESIGTRWEYLSVEYNRLEDPVQVGVFLEVVVADREPWNEQFVESSIGNCAGPFDAECLQANYRGRAQYLNDLGGDGWELIYVDDRSSADWYSINMIFKRPLD